MCLILIPFYGLFLFAQSIMSGISGGEIGRAVGGEGGLGCVWVGLWGRECAVERVYGGGG